MQDEPNSFKINMLIIEPRLIGMYAQRYYLRKDVKKTLTETVRAYKDYLPKYLTLPHPSPRNRFWLTKNPWFDDEVVPELQKRVKSICK